ncbi:MAG: TraR/DksA family transcriptional regulator [Actinobacteria bacterium]|nr:TraR/DksA family transcriptional regulator [Actinomycetota bacterium]
MDEKRAKELLAAERELVEAELASVRGEGREEGDAKRPAGDFNNEGLYEDELAAGREQDLVRRLERIERAEERLAAGTYGFSVKSGEPIPDGRLEAEPLAELTVDEEPGGSKRW